jgi:hypothetical protein
MSSAQATAEIFWTAYQALPVKERTSIIKKIMKSDELYEDIIDTAIAEERKGEPSISLEKYLEKRAKRKAA